MENYVSLGLFMSGQWHKDANLILGYPKDQRDICDAIKQNESELGTK